MNVLIKDPVVQEVLIKKIEELGLNGKIGEIG